MMRYALLTLLITGGPFAHTFAAAKEAPLKSSQEGETETELAPSVKDDLPNPEEDPLGTAPQHPPKSQRVEPKNLDTKFKNSLSLTLDPFRVLILDHKGPIALLGLEVVLEAQTLQKTDVIKACWPKIYSYVFQELYSIAPFLWDTGYTPTRKSLQKRLLRLCESFFGPGVVRGVVVQKAYMRPMRPRPKKIVSPLDKSA